MKNLFAIGLVLALLVACNDDDEENPVPPATTTLLKVQVDASFLTDHLEDNWIVVHDEDGRVLAYKSFETNMVFELKTDQVVSEKITVTEISHLLRGGVHYYSLYSYAKVAKGKTYLLKKSWQNSHTINGTLDVSVTDVVKNDQAVLSCKLGTSGSYSWAGDTKVVNIHANTYTGISKYILSVSDGSQMKYKILENVKVNDNYGLSFNEMLPFDNSITFTFPTCQDVMMYVNGSEPGETVYPNTYNIQSLFSGEPRSSLKVSYLNSLTNYFTELTLGYTGYRFEYSNSGTIPNQNISWPARAFSISELSINEYKIDAYAPYIWRTGSWQFNDAENFVYWVVHSPTDEQAFDEMPAEIIAKHPVLSPSKMTYKESKIYTQSIPYDEYVTSVFESKAVRGTMIGIVILN